MTYSIVARDARTGQLGVAVQTAIPAVGASVVWAEAGVGAIATQAMSEVSFGPRGLDALRNGDAPDAVVEALLSSDAGAPTRQVAMVDAHGRAAAFTGAACLREAGHLVGDGFSVQANMMQRDTVWGAMAEAFRASSGDLSTRLLAALDAAESEGGDIRGRQSAAIRVVEPNRSELPGHGVVLDVRVDDHDSPLDELRRLVAVSHDYGLVRQAITCLEALDLDGALAAATEASRAMPRLADAFLICAGVLFASGRVDEAREVLHGYDGQPARLREYLRRFAETGVFPADPDTAAALVD